MSEKELYENEADVLECFGEYEKGNKICDKCFDKDRCEGQVHYKKAYHILMEYWDSLPDEDKPEIDRRLKECGL